MKLKVLKERTQTTSVENDLRGLGHFEEPMHTFELSLPFASETSEGIEKLAARWEMNLLVEDGWIRLTKSAAPHIQAVKQFFCAADLMREGMTKSLRIDLVQGVRTALSVEDVVTRSKVEPGLLLSPALLYHFHRAGFWRENFSLDEIEALMQKRSLLHFSEENVAILMQNLGVDYSLEEGTLSNAQ